MSNNPKVYRQPPSAPTGQMDSQTVSESTRRAYRLAQALKEIKLENPITGLSGSLEVSYEDDDDSTDQVALTNTSTSTKRVEINLNGIAKLGTDFTPSNAADYYLRLAGETIYQVKTDKSFNLFPSNGALKFGIFGVGPSGQGAAITQTYATATRTHANFTSADLTGISSSTTGSALAEPSVLYTQAEMQQSFRRIQDQHNALRADLANLKQLVNSLVDDLQSWGWEA